MFWKNLNYILVKWWKKHICDVYEGPPECFDCNEWQGAKACNDCQIFIDWIMNYGE